MVSKTPSLILENLANLERNELEQRLREANLLRRIAVSASASLVPTQVLTAICTELARAIGVPQAAFARFGEDKSYLTLVAEHRPPGIVGLGTIISMKDNTITNWVVDRREPVAIYDAQNDPILGQAREATRKLGVASLLLVPIVAEDEVLGTLGLDSPVLRQFSAAEISLVMTAASVAVPALENARLFGHVQDELAERRRVEEVLRQSQARLNALIEAIPDNIYRFDATGRVIDARSAKQNGGLLIGKKLSDMLPTNMLKRALATSNAARRDSEAKLFEYTRPTEQGTRFFEAQVSPIEFGGAVVIERDVTERKRNEIELEQRRLQYQALVNSLEGIVWESTYGNGSVQNTFIGPQAEHILGYPLSWWSRPDSWELLLHPEDRDIVKHAFSEARKTGGEPFEIEYRMFAADGRVIWFNDRVNFTGINQHNNTVIMRGVMFDITERKRKEVLEDDRNKVLDLIARSSYSTPVLSEISAMLERQWPDSGCAIQLLKNGRLLLNTNHGIPEALATMLDNTSLGVLGGPAGMAVLDGENVNSPDFSTEQGLPQRFVTTVIDQGFRSAAAVPIRSSQGEILGAIQMFGRRQDLGAVAIPQMIIGADLAAIALEREGLQNRLQHQATHDPLTDLPNRKLFDDRLGLALSRANRSGQLVALMYLDLDLFKEVNDQYGHALGDVLLREVAQRLQSATRTVDTVARLGGDEFVVMLDGIAKESDAQRVAQKILELLKEPVQVENQTIVASASLGLVFYPNDGTDGAELLKMADKAMYEEKSKSKNLVL